MEDQYDNVIIQGKLSRYHYQKFKPYLCTFEDGNISKMLYQQMSKYLHLPEKYIDIILYSRYDKIMVGCEIAMLIASAQSSMRIQNNSFSPICKRVVFWLVTEYSNNCNSLFTYRKQILVVFPYWYTTEFGDMFRVQTNEDRLLLITTFHIFCMQWQIAR